MVTYVQAIILGLLQGVTELFPVSSLGHSVLIADLFGWKNITAQATADTSPFLTTLVLMHVATALALVVFYRAEWRRIASGFGRSLHAPFQRASAPAERAQALRRQLHTDTDSRLAWLLIAATIPAGLIGLVFEHKLRTAFGISGFAIIFLAINGVMLIRGDRLITKTERERPRQRKTANAAIAGSTGKTARVISDHLTFGRALLIGVAQIGALFAGISRSGITMLAGLKSGLSHQDAARFSFLLATPIILAAGLYKLPSVIHAAGRPYFGPMLLGSLLAGGSAYLAVRYLDRYFQDRSLRPFGWYCIGFAGLVVLVAIIRGSS